jgi:methionyl aminopeptidase
VGEIDEKITKLLEATKNALYKGIEVAKVGNRIGDIGYAIQSYVESLGYSVVRELVGHGVGKNLHEEPQVPNYGKKGKGVKIKSGLVIAIEPMVNIGTHKVKTLSDGWTVVTVDGKKSAHFEHTIAITEDGPRILSTIL